MAYIRGGGGANKIDFSIETLGSDAGEKDAYFTLPNTHKFKKLKIASYINIAYAYTGYPRFVIGGSTYNRPSENTEYNIQGQNVTIIVITAQTSYKRTGVNIELS